MSEVDVVVRLRPAVRVGLVGVLVGVLVACGGVKPGAERVQQLMSDLSIQQAGWVGVNDDQVWVRHVKDGVWRTGTYLGGKLTDDKFPSDFGWKQVSLADLRVDELDGLVAVQAEKVGRGVRCEGEVGMTTAGGRLSTVSCGGDVVSSAIDGVELPEISQWDAASFDVVLGELRRTQGAQSLHLSFLTPKSGSLGAAVMVRSVGPKVKGVSGGECMVEVTREGSLNSQSGMFFWGGCKETEAFGSVPFELADVSGAKLEGALKRAADLMEIAPEDIASFDVYVDGKGVLVLQTSPASGSRPKYPFMTVPMS